MPLLSKTRYEDYEVTLSQGDEIFTEYVIAQDLEHAAWAALELSHDRTCTLKNVRRCDDW